MTFVCNVPFLPCLFYFEKSNWTYVLEIGIGFGEQQPQKEKKIAKRRASSNYITTKQLQIEYIHKTNQYKLSTFIIQI